SFFWLVSVLLSSLIWFISVQVSNKNDSSLQYGLLIFGAAISVLLQEAFRYAYYRLLNGVFSVINILADAVGPGIVGVHGDSQYYFLTSAFLTMAIVFLHTFWGIIFFAACEKRKPLHIVGVVLCHLITSG
ncbi:hypothetical protein AB205_0127320, partial [Aquarana catesbeiana]